MKPLRIKSIGEFHKLNGLPQPDHPLISVVDFALVAEAKKRNPVQPIVSDYYTVSLKRGVNGKMRYGQQDYDFDEGVMYFISPGQVLQAGPGFGSDEEPSGWLLLVHPDFLWGSPLATTIKQYEYFDYSVNEALFLSDKEEATLNNIVSNIKAEYHNSIDKFSQTIIISQIETLLSYADRFYQRQFITRKITNHQVLERVEKIIDEYFKTSLQTEGLPSVQYVAEQLNISPKYLSSLLKSLTGLTVLQHIHEKLIEHAKGKLSTTDMTVSEIAYALGFEHPQSFSKFFKLKMNMSPLEFRESFN